MKLSLKTLVTAISLPVLMTACASNGDDVKEITAQDLQHHNWELVQVDGKNIVLDENQKAARLEIGENLTANGNAGCNNFFGQAELKNNQLRIEKMGMTMKMCMEDQMKIENAMTQTLSNWSDITLTKDGLVLKNADHELTFTLRDWVN
ncbi:MULTISPECIES: META domain-containing protein [Vibrio]|jgi:heat shock protein HslJ|uniref:Heat-shock protein HslJ n=39 Tax=Vibrio TaxID=662 RepID=A0A072K8V0_VIBPH|nr:MULTISPECIES: META domain-containing protein [Vibrio]EFO46622.1 heat shock protein HslJ [Vibrio parahaemolyticus AQ4037]EJG0762897.1 META domain-containing protein [Vibrio parahaemolyticus O5:K30]EJG0872449.1 META domain-containing protein [Vibrio parahaemolyticus O3]EJG0901107.1 META domain-containing protein [Vibrio parahaemolyticus O3:K56]EJG0920557.1 META domain-containing protein [Vibrio parahaemolyticus O1:K68]EJG0930172.1 META domain-containing protein [Vibrio parahaemolyticus O1]E